MSKITRTKDRIKQTGEVFTPLPLVDEILDKLDPELFKDPEKTFLDNSCGDGNFLVRVIAYKIANGIYTAKQRAKGSPAKWALKTTFGVDLMEDNVLRTREHIAAAAFLANHYRSSGRAGPYPATPLVELLSLAEKVPSFKKFTRDHENIIATNIEWHDALTYHYEFNGDIDNTERLRRIAQRKELGK